MQTSNNVAISFDRVLSLKWSIAQGQNLYSIREKQNMSPLDVCRKLKQYDVSLSRQYLRRIESDPKVLGVTPEVVQGLCQVFGIDIGDLLCMESRSMIFLGVDRCN
jgi:transcriptional regulator with XRE-family HTH domain